MSEVKARRTKRLAAAWMAALCAALLGAVAAVHDQALAQSTAEAPASAQPAGPAGAATSGNAEFLYRARAGDTLIGLAARLLRDPGRWRALQTRNRIAEPRRIPQGSIIRIPYDWLRITRQNARVIELVGAVTVDGAALARSATIEPGSTLETAANGSVTLELADGSSITLRPGSRLRIERLQRIDGAGADEALLELERGRLETEVKPRGDMGRFEIRTPAAVSAVRGTEFRASYAAESSSGTTETLDGTVGVSGAGAGVAVRAGFGARAAKGQPPQVPVPLLPAPALDALPALNERGSLSWEFTPVRGAATYRHQLARDAQFRLLVADTLTPAPASGIDDLADGRYWLRVRAIDPAGIEGRDALAELEQRRRLDAPAALGPIGDAKRIDATTRFEWRLAAGARGYNFQLAGNPEFTAAAEERAIDAPTAGAAAVATEVTGLAAGRYWWRIAAVDAAGRPGHWGEAQSFIQKPAPQLAEPVPPSRLHVQSSSQSRRDQDPGRSQSFVWTASEARQRYEWQLARDPSFRELLRSGGSSTPELTLEQLPYGRHYLRVRSIDADGFRAPFGPAADVDVPLPRWVWFALPAIMLLPVL